ncbi:unnamed protein product [Enterobius vermicularis]|uniref:DEP domain-containing protein n=1 Tax=Enterobius vermicularis TaxID=51028 RepID=A0A0N4UXZ0_ENTVE|nr:unnamed protein product [Enterobius vermicularis]
MENRIKLRSCKTNTSPVREDELQKPELGDGTSAFEGRFKATRMWNGVMKKFRNGMPLKRHRRKVFLYEDSFTGKEAVDFLMTELPKFYSEEKEITRSNCHMLLEKFIDVGLFLPVKGSGNESKDEFRESDIYRFSDIPLERVAVTPILVRRAASFNERCGFGTGSCSRDLSKIPRLPRGNNSRRVEDYFTPAAEVIPSVRSPLAKSKRLSSSDGNLVSMMSPKIFDPLGTVVSNDLPVSFVDEVVKEKDSQGKDEAVETKENSSPLDEVITELQKVGETNMNATLSIRSFGKVVQNMVNDEVSPSLPEFDFRLRRILRVDSLEGIVGQSFSGSDVKWNCEKVGLKGIVKVRNENDDLSTYLIAMMRYLTRWPFDQKFVEKVNVYPGMERNVFENVCEHFVKGKPILPNVVASAILKVVNLIKDRNQQKLSKLSSPKKPEKTIRMETVFSHQATPVTRYVNMLNKDFESRLRRFPDRDYGNPRKGISYRNSSGPTLNDIDLKAKSLIKEKEAALSNNSSSQPQKLEDQPEQRYDDILLQMQRRRRSPELILHLQELSRSRKSSVITPSTDGTCSPLVKTPRLGLSPLWVRRLFLVSDIKLSDIAKEDETDLIESVALLLLTLPPATRRRLHYLLRFMEKICKNHCLRLSPTRENRYVILERLSESVLTPSDLISPVQCLHLVTFLVDNQDEVFLVPERLKTEVEHYISDRQVELKGKENDEEADNSMEKDLSTKQYCEPIKINEYDQQKEFGVERHLLNLLDNIVNNETITLEERKKQLRKFKRTYPEIYAKRFPSPKPRKPRTPSFLDRLRNLNFRQ